MTMASYQIAFRFLVKAIRLITRQLVLRQLTKQYIE